MRFLCDHMLGTLSKWLRFLGYDTAYPAALDDNGLKALAASEERILLTRDHELSGRVPSALLVSSDAPDEQLAQVVRAFGLTAKDAMSRCSVCNEAIEAVEKEKAKDHVPEGVYRRQRRFWWCRRCGRFYWQGSHFDGVLAKIRAIEGMAKAPPQS